MEQEIKKKDEQSNSTCCHAGCEAAITSRSPKAKYCKKHRQNVYKMNYLKRNYKMRAKYQASRACFSGSPDSFIGQDLDDMIHQVLVRKRMELMGSPSLVEFLQHHQQGIKNKTRVQAKNHELRSFEAPLQSSRDDLNKSLFSTIPGKQVDSTTPSVLTDDDKSRNEEADLLTCFVDETKFEDVGVIQNATINVTSMINMQNFNGLNNQHVENKVKNLVQMKDNTSVCTPSLPTLLVNKVSGHLVNPERKSAFQETGAGDAKSLLAVRSLTQGQMT